MNQIKFTSKLPEFTAQFERGCQANLLAATMVIHEEVVKVLSGQRSGRTYKLPGAKGTWQASRPGEAPAVRLGDLRREYKFRTSENGLVGEVGNPLPYAITLEKGSRKMAPRPHLSVAFENKREEVKNILGRNVI